MTLLQAALAAHLVPILLVAVVALSIIPRLPKIGDRPVTYLVFAGALILPTFFWFTANQWKGIGLNDERLTALQVTMVGLALAARGIEEGYLSRVPALVFVACSVPFIWFIIDANHIDIWAIHDEPRLEGVRRQLILLCVEVAALLMIVLFPRFGSRREPTASTQPDYSGAPSRA